MVGAGARSLAFVASLVLVGLLIGWTSLAVDNLLGFQPLLPYPANLSGLLLIFVGSVLRFWAGSVFYRLNPSIMSFKAPSNLVTRGPWNYSRNLLYLGLILMGIGFSVLFSSYTDLILTIVGAVLLHLDNVRA